MPQFQLNDDLRHDALSDFTKGYIEAAFFTNGDSGDENENRLNDMGTGRLTKKAIAKAKADCDAFLALPLGHGNVASVLGKLSLARDYGLDRAGNDFWFTRQGHGVGFWDREKIPEMLRDKLSDLARGFSQTEFYAWKGWIHHG